MTDKTVHDIQAIIEIAQDALRPCPVPLGMNNILFIPESKNREAQLFDLTKFAEVPRRKTGTIKVFTASAFNTVLMHNRDAGDCHVYIDGNLMTPVITAVMNESGINGPGFRDFRCVLEFRSTPQWDKWKAIDGKMLNQETFAEFVEENLSDIYDPPGAEMLEIVTFLQATRSTDFKSAISLSTGAVQFQNVESMDARVGAGQIAVPTEFTLALAPIQGSETFKIPARFRYRLTNGKLTLGIKLLRIEDVLDQIFNAVVLQLVSGDGIVHVYGTP